MGGDSPHRCDDQDMTLFNGLLCSVGDVPGCDAVRRSQDSEGRWWRAPSLVGKDSKHGGAAASMSEEQTWGVFLYLIERNDKGAFDNWVRWIGEKSRPCWVKLGGSCRFGGLPQWCTDSPKTLACNFLPFECVAFERLARHFNEDPATVSRKIGCDLVMGAAYGAAAGALGLSASLLNNLPVLFAALPAAATSDPALLSKLQSLAANPTPPANFPPTFFSLGRNVNIPAALSKAALPVPPPNICVADLKLFGFSLPPVPPILLPGNPRGCVIPPNIFSPGFPFMQTGSLGNGFTTGYPVQLQVYGQALATTVPYAIHKIAVQIWLLQRLGLDDDVLRKATALVIKNGPKKNGPKINAFFSYLGEHGTNRIADIILNDGCPTRNGVQPPLRVEWIWEQPEGETDFSYWDCIFAAKLLVDSPNIGPPPGMKYMLEAQSAQVSKSFIEKCNVPLSTTVVAAKVSQPQGNDDYVIPFPSPSPADVWYQDKIFLAPCEGTYTIDLQVVRGSSAVQLVSSVRYGQPLLDTGKKKEKTKTVFLQPYEAIAVVLPPSSSPRLFNGATMKIKLLPTR
jgi:hypothetical protein